MTAFLAGREKVLIVARHCVALSFGPLFSVALGIIGRVLGHIHGNVATVS
jgi:hypothetical protein